MPYQPAFDTVRAEVFLLWKSRFLTLLYGAWQIFPQRVPALRRTMKSLDESFPWGVATALTLPATSPACAPPRLRSPLQRVWAICGLASPAGARCRQAARSGASTRLRSARAGGAAPRLASRALPEPAPGDLPRYAGHPMLQSRLHKAAYSGVSCVRWVCLLL